MSQKNTEITVLVENTANIPGFKAEFGWSVFIENEYGKLLFDAGQSSQILQNATLLDIDLNSVEKVFLSHGHFDHTGGLPDLMALNPNALIYAHPDVIQPKFHKLPAGPGVGIGMPKGIDLSRFKFSKESLILFPRCMTTGEIPVGDEVVSPAGSFYTDSEGSERDYIKDDQSVILESAEGLVVILGCCHSGLKATFDQIQNLTGKSKIFMVLGGMHLIEASKELIEQTINTLKEYSVSRIGIGHCTGYQGAIALQSAFQGKCFPCTTGVRLRV